jgi:hypothetical protein
LPGLSGQLDQKIKARPVGGAAVGRTGDQAGARRLMLAVGSAHSAVDRMPDSIWFIIVALGNSVQMMFDPLLHR